MDINELKTAFGRVSDSFSTVFKKVKASAKDFKLASKEAKDAEKAIAKGGDEKTVAKEMEKAEKRLSLGLKDMIHALNSLLDARQVLDNISEKSGSQALKDAHNRYKAKINYEIRILKQRLNAIRAEG